VLIRFTPPRRLQRSPHHPECKACVRPLLHRDVLLHSSLAAQRVAGSAALCAHSLQVHAYHVAYALAADGAPRGSLVHQEGDGEHTGVGGLPSLTVAKWRRRVSSTASGGAEGVRLLTRDGLSMLYTSCRSLRLLACGWPRTLHPPPVEYLARPPPSHPWLGAPGPRHAIAVHRPTHRRAARAGDIACSTHCRELERLP
jgi:hypothetical protein